MKRNINISPRPSNKINLKRALIITAGSTLLASMIAIVLFLYLNVGPPENAEAAPPPSGDYTVGSGKWSDPSIWSGSVPFINRLPWENVITCHNSVDIFPNNMSRKDFILGQIPGARAPCAPPPPLDPPLCQSSTWS